METKEMNEKLMRVGPGTPMGKMLRFYWWPVAATADLLDNPVRPVTILGEHLTLFRDRQGRLGLVGQRCAHRRFDLQYGIPENGGLRCPYHGWTYDTTGQCIEQPAEPEDSTFKDRVQIPSYPVQELGGLVFAYLGPQPAPLLPHWDLFMKTNSIRSIAEGVVPANWLQCMENSADPVHTEYLHGRLAKYVEERKGNSNTRNNFTHHTKVAFEKHPMGLVKRRLTEGRPADDLDWTHGHLLLFPDKVRLEGGGYERTHNTTETFQIRVPIDDEHTWHLCYDVFTIPGVELPQQDVIPVYHLNIKDQSGQPILDYTLGQDLVGWWSQGTMVDRSLEKLGQSDKGVILFRRMLKEQMDIVEQGGDPMNVFRDPKKNEYINTQLYEEHRSGGGREGFSLIGVGGHGRYNPMQQEHQAILQKALELAQP